MKVPTPAVIDFETEAIKSRPKYPPEPVGVSIQMPNESKPTYYAWGHHTDDNNCTKKTAAARLKDAYRTGSVLFHHSKFDLDVAETFFDLPVPPWHNFHDTMFLLFLDDPHAKDLKLKPAAERYLSMPPGERDVVKEWLLAHKKEIEHRVGTPIKPSEIMGYISYAPVKLVGPYANGDVVRTRKLFKKLYPQVVSAGCSEAYDRERKLLPILLRNEREGMRVDVQALEKAVGTRAKPGEYKLAIEKADQWLRKRLKTKDLNLDSDEDVADALQKSRVVTEWNYTAKGHRSVSKKNLTLDMYRDKRVASVMGYRNRMSTCLRMFAEAWLEMAHENNGIIATSWNQVRQSKGADGNQGTRTGRPSSSNPNFLNLPKDWYDKDDGYEHPSFLELPELPLMRRYILPDKGGVFGHRDYSQQELRILAHFEDGELLRAYKENPRLDVHSHIAGEISRIRGYAMSRRPVKITVFRKIYGGGVPATAAALNCSLEEAQDIINAVLSVIPGLRELDKELKRMGNAGEPVCTWGGRPYYKEEPRLVNGRMRDFGYKLLNYLIQGSAADCTKESIIRYDELRKDGRFLVTVYDENNISAPKGAIKQEMEFLRQAMESIEFDLPMLTDGEIGPNWYELKAFKEAKR